MPSVISSLRIVLRELGSVPRHDWPLVVRACGWLAIWTIAVRVLPLRAFAPDERRPAGRVAGTISERPPERVLERVRWAVDGVADRFPGASCLPRALAARSLLGGAPTSLRIGFVRRGGALAGHAWLALGDRIVVGDRHDLDRYRPLPSLPAVGGIRAERRR